MPDSNTFDDLMDHWEEQFERGKEISPEELCRDHPAFIDAAAKYIRAMKAIGSGAADTVAGPPQDAPKATRPDIPGYEILDELGRGGMGVVYKARQTSLKRLVALKMILREDLAGPAGVARFRAEAEALGQLQHPNIVQVYDVGETGGHPYFALELVPGGSLSARLTGEPLPPPAAAELVRTLARAVHFAHQRGFIHRDLKPGNILLGPTGEPKITDFGLAKRWSADGMSADGPARTATGEVLGTPAYMAPEQARGEAHDAGPGADVYALGAILYQLLTGRIPFPGQSLLEILDQVVKSAPTPPRRVRRAIPRDLETICLKCLEKSPARRYLSAELLADDLQRFLDGKPILARPITPAMRFGRWCRRNPILAATSATAFLALLGTALVSAIFAVESERGRKDLQASRDKLSEALTTSETHRKESVRLLAESALDRGLTLCDQGEIPHGMWWLARGLEYAEEFSELTSAIEANLTAWGGQVCSLERILEHPRPVTAAAIGPGDLFAAVVQGEPGVRVWSLATGERLPLDFQDGDRWAGALAFHPAEPILASCGGDRQLRIWRIRDGVKMLDSFPVGATVRQLRFSNDGHWLGVQTGTGVTVRDATDGFRPGKPSDPAIRCEDFAFRPGTTELVLADFWNQSLHFWDFEADRPVGSAVPVVEKPLYIAYSPNGRHFAVGHLGLLPALYEAEKRVPRQTPPGIPAHVHVHGLAFDPTSTLLLMARQSGSAALWNVREDRLYASPMAHAGGVKTALFTPDGHRVVTSGADRTTRVWRLPTDPALKSFPHPRTEKVIGVAISPDGQRVVSLAQFYAAVNGAVVDKKHAVLWDARSGEKLGTYEVSATGLRFDHAGNRVLFWGVQNQVQLLDLRTGKFSAEPTPGPAVILDALFSADDSRLITGSADGLIRFRDQPGDKAPLPLRHGEAVARLALSVPGTRLLAWGGPDPAVGKGLATLWNLTTGERLTAFDPREVVRAAALSPDGRWLATSAGGGRIRLWDGTSGGAAGTLEGHTAPVTALAFHPEGRLLASASDDGTVRLWRPGQNELVGSLRHPGRATGVSFSPDGRTLLTQSSAAGLARLWDISTRRQLGPPVMHFPGQTGGYLEGILLFAPDGNAFLAAGGPTVGLFAVPTARDRGKEFWSGWLRTRTGQELDSAGGVLRVLGAAEWHHAAETVPAGN